LLALRVTLETKVLRVSKAPKALTVQTEKTAPMVLKALKVSKA
jgi:hypothetical protein